MTDQLAGAMAVIAETAVAQLKARKYDQAEVSFRLLIERCGDNAELYTGLGDALAGLGNWGPAEDAFRKATTLDPDCSRIWFNLAYFLAFRQRFKEAKSACQKALDLKPEPENQATVQALMDSLP